jgi:two-component system, NarL family, captular synthesis response regulator RcsB
MVRRVPAEVRRGPAEHPDMRTVAVIEDHGPLRVFLRDVLRSAGWTVTGIAGSVPTGLDLVLDTEPDIAVVDLHLASEGGGHALIERLADAASCTRVVVFTASEDPEELRAVLEAGVHGIVLKEGGLPELALGLDAVASGARFLSPSLPAEARQRLSALQPV